MTLLWGGGSRGPREPETTEGTGVPHWGHSAFLLLLNSPSYSSSPPGGPLLSAGPPASVFTSTPHPPTVPIPQYLLENKRDYANPVLLQQISQGAHLHLPLTGAGPLVSYFKQQLRVKFEMEELGSLGLFFAWALLTDRALPMTTVSVGLILTWSRSPTHSSRETTHVDAFHNNVTWPDRKHTYFFNFSPCFHLRRFTGPVLHDALQPIHPTPCSGQQRGGLCQAQ